MYLALLPKAKTLANFFAIDGTIHLSYTSPIHQRFLTKLSLTASLPTVSSYIVPKSSKMLKKCQISSIRAARFVSRLNHHSKL